jgi:hypothetical protein
MRADTDYLTTADLARHWKLSAWTIREYARRGLIVGASRSRRRYRFSHDATLRSVAPARVIMGDERSDIFAHFTRDLNELRRS